MHDHMQPLRPQMTGYRLVPKTPAALISSQPKAAAGGRTLALAHSALRLLTIIDLGKATSAVAVCMSMNVSLVQMKRKLIGCMMGS